MSDTTTETNKAGRKPSERRMQEGIAGWEDRVKHPLSHQGKYHYGNTVVGAMKMLSLLDAQNYPMWATWTFASRSLAMSCRTLKLRVKRGATEANFLWCEKGKGVYVPDIVREGRWCAIKDIALYFDVSIRTVFRWDNVKGYLHTQYRPFRNKVCAPLENIIDILWWRKTRRILNKRTCPYSVEEAKLLWHFSNNAIFDLGQLIA